MLTAAAFVAVAVSSGGCEAGFEAAAPPHECTQPGEQCQLAEGPLGVCERARCGDGQSAPCYACTSQH